MDLVGMLGKMLLSGAMSKAGVGAGGLGSLLGGGSQGGAGGLGGLLAQLQGQQGSAAQTGGGSGNSASDLLGSLLGGGAAQGSAASNSGGIGALLGNAMGQQSPGAKAPVASADQTNQAAVLIRAMVNAAKSDGVVDEQEQQNIVSKLGDIGPEETAFIRAEMQAPLDVGGFVRSVPKGMEQQVYVMSLMTVNLDSKNEADYLDSLAKGFNISEQASNQIHAQLNVPQLYS